MDLTLSLITIAILALLLIRESFSKHDRAEEIRSATLEGIRRGFECHKNLTQTSHEEIVQYYRDKLCECENEKAS